MDDPKESNIVIFPGLSKNRPPQSLEEICRIVELAKTTRIEEVTEVVIVNLFENLFENAFDFTERQDTNKDMAFLIEALKSMLCRHDGLDHPFQDVAEKFFSTDENGDLTFMETASSNEIQVVEIELGGDGEMGC